MRNAAIVGHGTGTTVSFEQVKQYLEILKGHRITNHIRRRNLNWWRTCRKVSIMLPTNFPSAKQPTCRAPLGNITEKPLEEIFKVEKYERYIASYRRCPDCWMACFVEALLATPK